MLGKAAEALITTMITSTQNMITDRRTKELVGYGTKSIPSQKIGFSYDARTKSCEKKNVEQENGSVSLPDQVTSMNLRITSQRYISLKNRLTKITSATSLQRKLSSVAYFPPQSNTIRRKIRHTYKTNIDTTSSLIESATPISLSVKKYATYSE
jgi:hypothetical protein